jgi:hypothetical protein
MSGPYQPPGYPEQPEQWGTGQYDFPTVEYGGLGGNWPEPPKPKRSVGRLIVAVVSVLVIVGGVATGVVLLQKRHQEHEATKPAPVLSEPVLGSGSASAASSTPDEPGLPNGSTTLALSEGDCVIARVDDDEQYRALAKVPCGSLDSDLILAVTTPSMTGCADHEYLRLSAPSTGVYCFTLDIRQGDCVDANYLKTSCSRADFEVLHTEDGPGSSNSCTGIKGATHWVPIGRDPVLVGCLGPPTSS